MKKVILAILIFISAKCFSQNENQLIFLFDNSGSMSPYYLLPQSTFKLFSKALIKNSVKPGDKAEVMLFTKTDEKRGITSPKIIFDGDADKLIPEDVISKFSLMTGKDDKTGTTDLIEALDKAISNIDGNTGIIWLVTDNINDNSGSGDSSYQNTLEFYQKLRNDNAIQKILLYPIPEKLIDGNDTTKGYVAYALVYSKNVLTQQELMSYDEILRSV